MAVWKWNWRRRLGSATFLYLSSSILLLGSVAFLFSYISFSPFSSAYPFSSSSLSSPLDFPAIGCRPDGEGSWSIGVFYGDSPLSLKPIEQWDLWRNRSAAWPVANPVVTCKSLSDIGLPSNFVADPFLFIQGDAPQINILKRNSWVPSILGAQVPNYNGETFYLFFETKNSITLQGDIGAAMSSDQGATWQLLGTVLDEDWHLSYPYVFTDNNQIYLMPEGSKKGDLRLYRAVDFPVKWQLEKIIINKPLVDSFMIKHQDRYWIFGSDFSSPGAKKNGELEIWYADLPLGPWEPHKKNPIYNTVKSFGARNAGGPFVYQGHLYRPGQDCGGTYGRSVRLFKVTTLTTDEYEEVEVPLGIQKPVKQINAWNGMRYHQLDVHQLPSGRWVGVMDGDRVPSGEATFRVFKGYIAYAGAIILVILLGCMLSVIKCVLPLSQCLPIAGKRSDVFQAERRLFLYYKLGSMFTHLSRIGSSFEGRISAKSWRGRFVTVVLVLVSAVLTCFGTSFVYGGNGAAEPYMLKGHYSQFTILTMTYDARIWNLKMFLKHYSRCSSVREIVVVWNKGPPPEKSELESLVPVRIRVEKENSLNNRFNIDPLIKTRAVLELDDDILMTCDDVERGFRVWREYPDRIVGFYPRVAEGNPLRYHDEKYARNNGGYNMILTGAAFIDYELAFNRYWSSRAKPGREIVENLFNCEDVLLNFLYVNASAFRTVQYVKPAWAIDTSKFSGVAISRNTKAHYNARSECIQRFTELYGSLAGNRWSFGTRRDGWDV